MFTIISTLLRTTIIFFILLALCRILGNKQISQLTYFNYITGITIGSIAGIIISISDRPYITELVGLIWWCLLTILISFLCLKSGNLRKIIDGQPNILIKKGKIQKQTLSKIRLNIDDLLMLIRKQGIFSIIEVYYAILEADGTLSILKKPELQQVTISDMHITSPAFRSIPSEIIVDGKIVYHNLRELNIDEAFIHNELQKQGIYSLTDVFYAELQSDGSLYVDQGKS